MRERLKNGFASDDVVAVQLDLIGLEQQDLRRIEQEARRNGQSGSDGGSRNRQHQDAAIERPASTAKFFAANFERLLAAEVTRLLVGEQFRAVRLGGGRCTAALHGFYAFQTTTSCSRMTPKDFSTRSRTSVISASMSLAEALPAFTKKLAWRSLTRASPALRPLRPSSSIMRPADAPGGFLKMQPALFCPSGWLARRFSLQIRIPLRISRYGLEGNSSFTASIISSGAKDVCRYSKEI